jgi:tetratricopeptide (TPR) repeat protein
MTSRRVLPYFLCAAVCALLGAACSRAVENTAPGCASAEPAAQPIDTEVMAFLSAARALHHEADLAEDAKDLPRAIAAMNRLVHLPLPHPGVRVVEVEEVIADAYARMADLEVRAGDVEGALRDSQAGLDHASDPTYFRGHLLEVEGVAEKARAGALADAGRAAEAEQAREKAIVLLHDAVKVQEQVIDRSLGDAAPAAPASGGR